MNLRLTFRQKMWLPSGLVAICLAVTLVFASRLGQQHRQVLSLIEEGHAPAVQASGDLEKLFAELERTMMDAVGTDREEGLVTADGLAAAFFSQVESLRTNPVVPAGEPERLRTLFEDYYTVARRVAEDLIHPVESERGDMVGSLRSMKSARWALAQEVEAGSRFHRNGMRAAFEESRRLEQRLSWTWSIAILIGIAVIAMLSRWIVDGIARPLGILTAAARRVATTGDLTQPIDVHSSDEVGTLADAFTEMMTRLRASDELAAAKEQAEAANRAKSLFLANMSHELRTPLNAIIGFTQLVAEGELGAVAPEQRDCLDSVLSSSDHLLRLINDILDLSKVESGKLEFFPVAIDMKQVVEGVLSDLQAATGASRVRTEIDEGLGVVVLDQLRFKQVLSNYVSNAIKFSPPGAEVVVRVLVESAETFRVEVHDCGIGISPEDLGRLFTVFQQLDGGYAKRYQGTGLGLALTRRLVEAQGGVVGATSTLGGGSTFSATLPRRFGPPSRAPALPEVSPVREAAAQLAART